MYGSCPNCGEKIEHVNAGITLTHVERNVSGVCRRCGKSLGIEAVEGQNPWKKIVLCLTVILFVFLVIMSLSGKDVIGGIKVLFFGY